MLEKVFVWCFWVVRYTKAFRKENYWKLLLIVYKIYSTWLTEAIMLSYLLPRERHNMQVMNDSLRSTQAHHIPLCLFVIKQLRTALCNSTGVPRSPSTLFRMKPQCEKANLSVGRKGTPKISENTNDLTKVQNFNLGCNLLWSTH